jgi:predicted nucleic acid-binding protein
VKLAADANVLLSALIGGQATLVLRHPAIEEILTTEVTLAEVQEYAGQLARSGVWLWT